jgi:succinate dehydrogenase/fumarate reductase flavoprotein subunit
VNSIPETDVLIVGGGAAGLRASIEARKMGLNVMLISKAPIGASSCTLYVGGGFRAAFGSYTKENHFKDTLHGGRMINDRNLVKVLVEEAPSRLLELRDFGVNLNIRNGGASVTDGPITAGLGLIKPLSDYAKKIGVTFLENFMALDLMVDDYGVHGLIAFQIPSGKIIPIYSKSIVLSTGGYSQIFLRSDNPVRVSGDGCAMALKAGAKLVDMEFTQFFPLGLAEEGKPPWLFPAYDAKIINRAGEDVVLKYNFNKPLGRIIVEDRDLFSRALFKEIDDGLGFDDSLIMDIGDKDPSTVMPDSSIHLIRVLGLSGSRFRVAPTAHFTMGGILIDENCSTGIPGLYACGEVCGGVHGANRLGGNALTETIVFGARAGASASKYALTSKISKVDCNETIQNLQRMLNKSSSGSYDIDNLRFELKHSMWKYCGVIRNGSRLRDLLKIIDELNVKVEDAIVKSKFDALKLFELKNMLLVSSVVATSSLIREESRGAHYRSDFPNESDAWLKRICFSMKDGKLHYEIIMLN